MSTRSWRCSPTTRWALSANGRATRPTSRRSRSSTPTRTQYLAVAVADDEVVGTLQLTFTSGLSRLGMTRATVEAVRVRSDQRGNRLGERLMKWAIDEARTRGCGLIQLTTDASRADAHRFYERLGFTASHVGMKLAL
jgi:GNAT superfamily N-acetyltransferase